MEHGSNTDVDAGTVQEFDFILEQGVFERRLVLHWTFRGGEGKVKMQNSKCKMLGLRSYLSSVIRV